MKASPGARSWIAAGVRHEVLTRALPALRHDMSAPVSVMRMGLLMLKRQVAAPTVDAVACQERVALIDSQIGELVSAVRSLRDWELSTNDDGILRSTLVTQCVALMRPAFDLQGVQLEIGAGLEADAAGTGETRWASGAALRYLTLGALAFLLDSTPNLTAIHIDADGDAALRLSAVAGEAEHIDAMAGAHRAPRKLAIDTVALQSLADDLGYTLALERDTVRLPLVAG